MTGNTNRREFVRAVGLTAPVLMAAVKSLAAAPEQQVDRAPGTMGRAFVR